MGWGENFKMFIRADDTAVLDWAQLDYFIFLQIKMYNVF